MVKEAVSIPSMSCNSCSLWCHFQDPLQRPPMSSVAIVLRALRDNPHVAAQLDALHCPELCNARAAAYTALLCQKRML